MKTKKSKIDNIELKKFFIGLAFVCVIIAIIILIVMLKPSVTGNVVSENVDGGVVVPSGSGEIVEKETNENFFKHIIRIFVESFDKHIRF